MNHLYYGDNLDWLRNRDAFPDGSVDLIYLDPPFNSNASYNVLFRGASGGESAAQIEAFDDTWTWDDTVSGQALVEVRDSPHQDAARMLDAMVGFLGKNAMTAYLCMMGVRLIALHRVLKPTGSLYLHCDPTASHYLKILLDAVFGAKNFRSEIIWRRTSPKGLAFTRFAANHDVILSMGKTEQVTWNPQHYPHSDEYLRKYNLKDEATGRRFQATSLINPSNNRPNLTYSFGGHLRVWRWTEERMRRAEKDGLIYFPKNGGVPREKRYLDEQEGVPLSDLWADIPPINSQAQERLGYPTQKPVALLERIIAASSNPGDTVLDPFCGCGTTVHAAQKLGRRWIGIDVTHVAVSLIETRLFDAFGRDVAFEVHGTPKDLEGAQALFDRDDPTKKEFEKWACSLVKAYPQGGGRKGADGGVDGVFRFGPAKEHQAVVSVKGGRKVGVQTVRELSDVVEHRGAQIGIYLTLSPPTKPMLDWAARSGTFTVEGYPPIPRIQIVTIEEALHRREAAIRVPMRHADTYKAAPKEKDEGAQGSLGF